MCGIVFVTRQDGRKASRLIRKQYDKQYHRGHEGFGYICAHKGIRGDYVRTETADVIFKEMMKLDSDTILFHHRYPTSTPNFREAAHPIHVSNDKLKYDYFIVHNGVISNTEELKKKHDEEGFVYTTLLRNQWVSSNEVLASNEKWNDSEAFAIELAKDLDGPQKGIFNVKGSIAFVCMQVNKETSEMVNVFFGRNYSNPLKCRKIPGQFITISSEGDGEDCKPDYLYTLDPKNRIILERYYCVGTSFYGGHDDGFRWPRDSKKDINENKGHTYPPKTEQKSIGFTPEEEDITTPEITYPNDNHDPVVLVTAQDEKEAEAYYATISEYYSIEDELKVQSIPEEEKTWLEERLKILNDEITAFDEQYIRKNLKQEASK